MAGRSLRLAMRPHGDACALPCPGFRLLLGRFKTADHFPRQQPILLGHLVRGLGLEDRLAVLLGHRYRDGAADPGLEIPVQPRSLERLLDPAQDLRGQPRSAVDAGKHDAEEFEIRVVVLTDCVDVAHRVVEPLDCKPLRCRSQDEPLCHAVSCGGGGVDVRGRVQKDEVPPARGDDLLNGPPQAVAVVGQPVLLDQLAVNALQVPARRDQADALWHLDPLLRVGRERHRDRVLVAEEHLVAALVALGGDAEAAGGPAVGVEVDDERSLAECAQRRSEVHGGRGLAHAALLVADGDHVRWC